MSNFCFGLDIGGTKCAVTFASLEESGGIEILFKKRFETESRPPEAVLERFSEIMRDVLSERKLTYSDITRIGISCGGPLNAADGIILSPPHLPGWDDVHIVEYFEKLTGVPAVLCNDADASALAEWKFGAGRGCRNMVFLTCGTGFGAGLILNGELYSGTMLGSEFGHIRLRRRGPVGFGKQGTTESYCSGAAFGEAGKRAVRRALKNGEKPELLKYAGTADAISAKEICALAKEGDEMCIGLCREFGAYLGEAISILIDLLDPQMIVIAGVYMRAEELIRDSMMETIGYETLTRIGGDVKIVPAQLGENIGDYAALSVAATSVKSLPGRV